FLTQSPAMNQLEPAVESIDDWRRKIFDLPSSTSDRLGSVTVKTLELIDCAIREDVNSENVQCALETLESVRAISLKYDNQRDSPTHQMIYALSHAIQLLMQSKIDKN
ncbi:hypothetical protein PFISCL1PPCAC_5557, partial [Pristionchus fissidentatus]